MPARSRATDAISSSLECPRGADRHRVRVAVRRADALVLGAERHSPGLGLQAYAVSELVVRLIVTIRSGWTRTAGGGNTVLNDGGHVGLQPRHARLAEHIEERYRQG